MKKRSNKIAKILLVEDNEGDILLTKEAFETCKIKTQISVAKNGQEALDYLFKKGKFIDAEQPDIILLDINLPLINGQEVLRQIKSSQELKKIPVIMLSTSSNQKDINQAYDNHSNSYVQKPLEIEEFFKAILKIEEFWLELTVLAS